MTTTRRRPAQTTTPAHAENTLHGWLRAATLPELEATGSKTVHLGGRTLVLWRDGEPVYALDNRCPHMGFPLDRGTCRDGILTCHWHAARFDLQTGGTFDPFADDVQTFPVEVRGEEIWVYLDQTRDERAYYRRRLREGLEQDVRLVLAKSAIALLDGGDGDGGDARDPFRIGLEFGVHERSQGWGQGLTMLTCLGNLLPVLAPADRPRALYAGLDAVSRDTAGAAPRFVLAPLPGALPEVATLKRWLRQFLAVRDDEGAERLIVSAVRAGLRPAVLAELLFSAATDYRYLQIGHALDFTNKAFEALDLVGWDEPELAAAVLSSVVRGIAQGSRQEESNAWRHPVDVVAILEAAFPHIAGALASGTARRGIWAGRSQLAWQLLEDDPAGSVEALLQALRDGATAEELAGAVSYAAALRIARFHLSNEYSDWDTTLHTFTFAHAVHMGLRRVLADALMAPVASELLRGVFDAAMSLYLDRFLNIPAAPLPEPEPANDRRRAPSPESFAAELLALLDRQQQVNQAAELVARYLTDGGDDKRLLATLGTALLREDRDFHTIQTVEAAFREHALLSGAPEAAHVLIAATRYLAAHAPTPRAQGQTYSIAWRLRRGDRLFEG
jgi:nitrite reductase/ring-hydroxylating ferredoxin subunit